MLNWLTRYAFVCEELGFDADGALLESVLDVGCGPHGLSTAARNAEFVGVDILFPHPVASTMAAFRNDPGPLPFADGAFETVVCLDVLEHIPRPDRARFVVDLTRVAARRVLIACPSDEAAWIDNMLRSMYAAHGLPSPEWLTEHDEHGLPAAREIADYCTAPDGFRARELPMTNGLLSTLAVMADMLPEYCGQAATEFAEQREGWLELFQTGRFGACFRKGYVLERIESRAALVDPAHVLSTAVAAARCPACGVCSLSFDGLPRCGACGHELTRDPSGAWSLSAAGLGPATPVAAATVAVEQHRAAPGPPSEHRHAGESPGPRVPAPGRPSLTLTLSPDWERPGEWLPALAQYIAGADGDGSTLISVDASSNSLPMSLVAEMLELACDTLSDGRPFADVALCDSPPEGADAICVHSAADVARALGCPPVAAPSDPESAVEHLLAVKRLVDAMRGRVESWRYRTAPDPWREREPLVSVRIPTWNGRDLLVQRAIPSALSGSYRNVEVVVCSDGPDSDARAAVEAIRDPRVRYLELPERPLYASYPWSFWQTAGIHAVNRALDDCRGSFIAPLDHDDAFTHEHVHRLLAAAAASRSDLVYGQALGEHGDGSWRIIGSAPLVCGAVTHGSVLYSGRLGAQRMDADSWLLGEPGDWNMWRRILDLGAPATLLGEVVLLHFREYSSITTERGAPRVEEMHPGPGAMLDDALRTGLGWMLEVALPAAVPA